MLVVTVLLVLLLVGVILKIRSWYRGDADDAVKPDELLLQFHELHRQGELDEDEYRSIRGRLSSQPAEAPAVSTETGDLAGTLGQEPCSEGSEQ